MANLLPELTRLPRVVITQVISPASAHRAVLNFDYLLGLGFTRFKLLPAFYLPWRDDQIEALQASFAGISAIIRDRWERDLPLYLRNLFSLSSHPTFNDAVVVDSDRSVYATDMTVISLPDPVRAELRAGSLDALPDAARLERSAAAARSVLPTLFPPEVWRSTQRADAELTRFCRGLYPHFAAARRARVNPASAALTHVPRCIF